MRVAFPVALWILLPAVALGQDRPIPQDPAKIQMRLKDRLEWNRKTLQAAYDTVGRRSPKWDKPAREALDMAARLFSQQYEPPVYSPDVSKAAKVAIDAGCDDPLIAYLFTRFDAWRWDDAELRTRLKKVAEDLRASRYPWIRRAVALRFAADALPKETLTAETRKLAEREYDDCLAMLAESAKADERTPVWEDSWFDTLEGLIRGYRRLGIDPIAAHGRVDARLAKVPEAKVMRYQVRGSFFYQYAWEARTNARAPAVPRGGLASFETRCRESKKAFAEAWRLRPDDGRTAEYMLDLEKSISGNRAEMERWFERAMNANPNSVSACRTKLDWLDPKWHGSDAEMLAFGRACRDTKNWHAGITLLSASAHFRHASNMDPRSRQDYLGSPLVWADLSSVFEEYLKHYPQDTPVRSEYAALAFLAGKLPEAHKQFQTLGNRLTTWPYFPNIPLESLKQMREQAASSISP